MKLYVNNKEHTFEKSINIDELLLSLNLSDKAVVAELNLAIIKKEQYSTTYLNDQDRLELLEFVGGG